MKQISMLIASVILSITALSANASTAALVLGSGWQSFQFGSVGSSWDTDYTFTLTSAAILKVTDAYLSGDQFSVFSSGFYIGDTSVPTSLGDQIGANYDAAYADSRWSSAFWTLRPGTYDISGTASKSPFGGGAGAISLTAAVPEPGDWAMMATGLGFMGFIARRKNKKIFKV